MIPGGGRRVEAGGLDRVGGGFFAETAVDELPERRGHREAVGAAFRGGRNRAGHTRIGGGVPRSPACGRRQPPNRKRLTQTRCHATKAWREVAGGAGRGLPGARRRRRRRGSRGRRRLKQSVRKGADTRKTAAVLPDGL